MLENNLSIDILSNIIVYMKYAKYLHDEKRRENWYEICERNMNMHIEKYPVLKDEIIKCYKEYVFPKKVLPSMRSLQFAGPAIKKSPNRIYNCSFVIVDHYSVFHEIFFNLLSGVGVGYSVQKHHVEKLPEIVRPTKKRRYLITDSIEGWADSVKQLVKAYLGYTKYKPEFDFSDIRKKGTPLLTSGGKAPGPQPLKDCLHNIEKVFERKENGEKLTPLECHDIICYIADAVLSGGIRRAALISLFSLDDEDMLTCKYGNWWELNPQRARANNSVVLLRHKITKDVFLNLWEKIKASNSGEPGIFFTNNAEVGGNPCMEISLKNNQFCNLTTLNISDVKTQEELNNRARAAAFLGTLQAGYTDFHYLKEDWKKTTEKEALLGVSICGLARKDLQSFNFEEAAKIVLEENERVSKILGINKAARTTCVKPEGTASLVLGSSSGIHSWFANYYFRRIRINKTEALYSYLKENHPELLEDDFLRPHLDAVITVPVKAPENSITRDDETAIDLLERVKFIYKNWIIPGHRKGDNTHNVSVTVSIKDHEWDEVAEWLWENRDCFTGISVLPYDLGSYKQAPFEKINQETFEKNYALLKSIDLSNVFEMSDETKKEQEIACSGFSCEVS